MTITDTSESSDAAIDALGDCIECIDHIAIAVVDLNQAIRWYTRSLGFRLLETRETRGERTAMLSAVVQAGSSVVVLVQGSSADSQVSRFIQAYGPGVQHVAFRIRNLDEALDQLTREGHVPDTPIIVGDGIRQVFLKRVDGSGVRVELIERRGGSFNDDSVERLFRAFEAHDLY